MTLEDYLRQSVAAGAIDFCMRVFAVNGPDLPAAPGGKPVTTFYIHPAGQDGATASCVIRGDRVECIDVTT